MYLVIKVKGFNGKSRPHEDHMGALSIELGL